LEQIPDFAGATNVKMFGDFTNGRFAKELLT
jgi:hypothetical protein